MGGREGPLTGGRWGEEPSTGGRHTEKDPLQSRQGTQGTDTRDPRKMKNLDGKSSLFLRTGGFKASPTSGLLSLKKARMVDCLGSVV